LQAKNFAYFVKTKTKIEEEKRMLLVKTVEKKSLTGNKTTEVKSMLKLFGNGAKTSLFENGYITVCEQKCINPSCKHYSIKDGCAVKDKLIENWIEGIRGK